MEIYVYILLEIPTYEAEIKVFTTANSHPVIDFIKKIEFRSDKSLNKFLEINKEDILKNIPAEETEVLEILEVQGYLDYLKEKWYHHSAEQKILSPEEILGLGLKHKIIIEKDILDYLLKSEKDYVYEIHKDKIII